MTGFALRMPWPLPAVAAWTAGWAAFFAALHAGAQPVAAFAAAAATGAALALSARGRWRRALCAAGFPLSALALGALPGWPAWGWLALVAPLALAYPLRAWRDAPFFPTPANALDGLERVIPLAPGARVLDAGCGLGHGLRALRRVWPQARIDGVEWSRLLAWGAARACRTAHVTRGDMWAGSWAGYDVVYLFQRPESMERAWRKAQREMASGWLVSLEFPLPGVVEHARLGDRPLWIYRISGSTGQTPGR